MLISIHDNSLQRVAYMDNLVPNALHYYDDNWRRLLKEATSTLSFSVDKIGHDKEQYLNEDNYVSFKYEGAQYLFSIMRTEETENKIIVYAENLNLELLNEVKKPIDVTTAQNLVWYLNNSYILTGAGLTLGINEVSDLTRKIKLESEQTGLARLTSIANNFDAEIEFVTELNSDGTLKAMIVNFYKKYDGANQGVGTSRQDCILYYGKNIEGVKRTVDKTDSYNAIEPTGKDGLNIAKLEKTEYDENGEVEYYTPWNVNRIYAPQSKSKYRGQLLNDVDGWLNRPYSADGTANVNTLYTLALNELKKHAYPAVTYDVTGYFDLNVGDTVRIQDSGFAPALTLQARVAEQSICFSDPTKNKTTFGNILALESRVSQDLTGRLKELVDQATPYRFEIISDNGLTFKNSEGNTTLTARVYKGSDVQEVSVDSFEWLIDGVQFGGTTKSQLVNASQVTGTAVVRYNAKIGDAVIGGLEVTLQDVSDGKQGVDGKPTGVTQSNTVPTETYDGMLWQYTGTEDLSVNGTIVVPKATYLLTDDTWSAYELPKENISVDKLEDVSSSIGKVYNEFEYTEQGAIHKGSITINENLKFVDVNVTNPNRPTVNIDFATSSSFSGMQAIYTPIKGGAFQMATYTPQGIYFQDSINGYSSALKAETLVDTGWVQVTLLNGSFASGGGGVYVRRYMGRYQIWLNNYIFNGTGAVFVFPSGFAPGRTQMVDGLYWAESGTDRFQIENGRISKISNNSTTRYFRTVIEYY